MPAGSRLAPRLSRRCGSFGSSHPNFPPSRAHQGGGPPLGARVVTCFADACFDTHHLKFGFDKDDTLLDERRPPGRRLARGGCHSRSRNLAWSWTCCLSHFVECLRPTGCGGRAWPLFQAPFMPIIATLERWLSSAADPLPTSF